MTNYTLRHGEAVAKGIALDVSYAGLIGLIPADVSENIVILLEQLGFDLHIPVKTSAETDRLLKGIEEFRQHLGGQLTITLITGIGKQRDVHKIDLEVMKEAIRCLNNRSKRNVA
jgi:3-dehydroquinate synthase